MCEPLLAHAEHIFTTKDWTLGRGTPTSPEDGWAEVAEALGVGVDRLRRLRQVHGAAVVVAGDEPGAPPEADVIVSARLELAVAVQAADCVPLLVADTRTGAVAAAHAGWRGLAACVPGTMVSAMAREFGSRPGDLLAAIGPAIGPCCYEVGNDVRQAMVGAAGEPEAAAWFRARPTDGKWMFDTWASARAQLVAAGVPRDRVYVAGLCTMSHPDTFCSYRRDGPPAGRIAAAIKPRMST